jgi:hypothetical protein
MDRDEKGRASRPPRINNKTSEVLETSEVLQEFFLLRRTKPQGSGEKGHWYLPPLPLLRPFFFSNEAAFTV